MGPPRRRRGGRRHHRLRRDQLGDIVFVELPAVGRPLEAAGTFGVVESVKAVSDLFAPGRRRGDRHQRCPRRQPGAGQQRPVRRGLDDPGQGRRRRPRSTTCSTRPPTTRSSPRADGRRCPTVPIPAPIGRGCSRPSASSRSTSSSPTSPPRSAPRGLDLPPPEPELELAARLTALAGRNRTDLVSFLGAGVYRHWIPPAVDQLLLRGEWYTAYTPYQPEISQGTLQTIYEYESLMAELVDLDVVSASHYDGAAATAEAALMTVPGDPPRAGAREPRRPPALPRDAARRTSAAASSSTRSRWSADGPAAGTTDLEALERMLAEPDRPVAGVIAAQPDFLGLLEPMPAIGELAHAAGALFVAVIEPVSLAVLAPPGAYGADIAAGEGQPLGIAPQYGGPYLGILASTDALVRQIPGRLVGMTTDLDGQRAFVMTMRAREQDIRRDKAASNICTNQALLRAGRLDLPRGHRPARPARRRGRRRGPGGRARGGARRDRRAARSTPAPYLNEFAVRVPDAPAVHAALLERGDPRRAAARRGGTPTTRRSPTACWSARPRSPRAPTSRDSRTRSARSSHGRDRRAASRPAPARRSVRA